MKNAIDWASRPSSDIAHVFGGKQAALIGASSRRFGGIAALLGAALAVAAGATAFLTLTKIAPKGNPSM